MNTKNLDVIIPIQPQNSPKTPRHGGYGESEHKGGQEVACNTQKVR